MYGRLYKNGRVEQSSRVVPFLFDVIYSYRELQGLEWRHALLAHNEIYSYRRHGWPIVSGRSPLTTFCIMRGVVLTVQLLPAMEQ